jgi:hypothetical protein
MHTQPEFCADLPFATSERHELPLPGLNLIPAIGAKRLRFGAKDGRVLVQGNVGGHHESALGDVDGLVLCGAAADGEGGVAQTGAAQDWEDGV